MKNGEPLLLGVVLLRILELFLFKKISQVWINLSFLVLSELPEVNYDCDQPNKTLPAVVRPGAKKHVGGLQTG